MLVDFGLYSQSISNNNVIKQARQEFAIGRAIARTSLYSFNLCQAFLLRMQIQARQVA